MKNKLEYNKLDEYVKFLILNEVDELFNMLKQICDEIIIKINPDKTLMTQRNIYLLYMLFSISIVDIKLFLRLFKNEYTAFSAVEEMEKYSYRFDKWTEPKLQKTFKNFYNEMKPYLTANNIIFTNRLVEFRVLEQYFEQSCFNVFNNHIIKFNHIFRTNE